MLKFTQQEREEPIFLIVNDNSQSMLIGQDSIDFINTIRSQNEKLRSELIERGKVEYLSFGEQISDSIRYDYTERLTDFQAVLDEIDLRYQNRNLGAVILSSDGIYNQGIDPRYLSLPSAPIITIAYGDTTQKRDLILEQIINNKIAFLGNDFPIEVQIKNTLEKNISTEIQLYKAKELIASKTIQIDKNQSFVKVPFLLNATTLGIQKFLVNVKPVEGEYTVENNTKELYVDVLDGRQNVLLVSNAPHPDVSALQSSILEQENFKVELKTVEDKIDLDPYDLVILHDIPNRDMSSRQFLFKLMESNKSILFIFGSASTPDVLKRYFNEAKFISNSTASNEAFPIRNEDFPLFQTDEKNAEILNEFPPLLAKGQYFKNPSKSLTAYFQKIGIVETKFPLIDFWDREGQKFGFIYGEGLWRWRIANYRSTKNHEAFNEIINKSVQYLSLKADKSFFRVSQENTFFENQAIKIFAQLYNESYEPINEPTVELNIQNEEGVTYQYAMSQTESAYFLQIEELTVGSYKYEAQVDWGGKLYKDQGQFSVKSIKFEQINTTANHQLLSRLSVATNGKIYYPQEEDRMLEDLRGIDAPIQLYETEEYESLINLKWLFFIILSFLSIEWFIRKRQGAY